MTQPSRSYPRWDFTYRLRWSWPRFERGSIHCYWMLALGPFRVWRMRSPRDLPQTLTREPRRHAGSYPEQDRVKDFERRMQLPPLELAAEDVIDGINRCIRSGEPPTLRTIRWWGGHLSTALELGRPRGNQDGQ